MQFQLYFLGQYLIEFLGPVSASDRARDLCAPWWSLQKEVAAGDALERRAQSRDGSLGGELGPWL